MAKKNAPDMSRYVKKENMYLACMLALAIGFFGGVMFGLYKSGPSGPVQTAAPMQPAPMPQSNADLSNAIAALEREVAANPSNVSAWISLGNNYFDTAQHEKSIQAYQKALRSLEIGRAGISWDGNEKEMDSKEILRRLKIPDYSG